MRRDEAVPSEGQDETSRVGRTGGDKKHRHAERGEGARTEQGITRESESFGKASGPRLPCRASETRSSRANLHVARRLITHVHTTGYACTRTHARFRTRPRTLSFRCARALTLFCVDSSHTSTHSSNPSRQTC
eukprot:5161076-Pleurochrysis_carterae.AAC.1